MVMREVIKGTIEMGGISSGIEILGVIFGGVWNEAVEEDDEGLGELWIKHLCTT